MVNLNSVMRWYLSTYVKLSLVQCGPSGKCWRGPHRCVEYFIDTHTHTCRFTCEQHACICVRWYPHLPSTAAVSDHLTRSGHRRINFAKRGRKRRCTEEPFRARSWFFSVCQVSEWVLASLLVREHLDSQINWPWDWWGVSLPGKKASERDHITSRSFTHRRIDSDSTIWTTGPWCGALFKRLKVHASNDRAIGSRSDLVWIARGR